MIDLKTIEERLVERRKELAAYRERHERLLKSLQRELQAAQSAFYESTGAITELECLKRLFMVQNDGNGQSVEDHHKRKVQRVRESEHV